MRNPLCQIVLASLCLSLTALPATATESTECNRQNLQNCLDGVGSGVTSLDSMRISTDVDISASEDSESAQGQASLADRLRARAAGDGLSSWSLWAGYTYSDFESVTRAPYQADLHNVVVGADTLFTDRFLFGVFAGYESLNTDTAFNGGGQDVDGFTAGPYFAYLFNDTFSADFTLGYAHLSTDQDRLHPNGNTLTVDFSADRAFAVMNFNAVHNIGNALLGGRVGYMYAREEQNGYTETGGAGARTVGDRGLTLGQAYIGGDVAYAIGSFEPYVHGVYRYDVSVDDGADAGGLPGTFGNPQPNDPDEIQWGVGFRYFGPSGISAQAEWVTTVGRELFDEDSINLLVRMDF